MQRKLALGSLAFLALVAVAGAVTFVVRARSPGTSPEVGATPTPAPSARRRPRRRPKPDPEAVQIASTSPWASPEACRAALSAGHRAERAPGVARLATWNIRWFPDGRPAALEPPRPDAAPPRVPQKTNVEWLACAIAWLDVDVLALEELQNTPAAVDAFRLLRTSLDALTGGAWRLELDRCPEVVGRQHVGLLYNGRRVTGRAFGNVSSLNPLGGCERLRPGFSGYFRFPGKLDLHFLAVHLRAGVDDAALGLRLDALRGAERAFKDLQEVVPDGDVVIAGDFNTMGCAKCEGKLTPTEELDGIDRTLGSLATPFRRVPESMACSKYYRGKASLLDHFVVTTTMQEVEPDARTEVDGYCRETACAPLDPNAMPRAFHELSDHCPVVLSVKDADLDRPAAIPR